MTNAARARILPTHTPQLFQDAVARATELLRAGEVVALPTETVYGLAANALDAAAVTRIFEIKGRPSHNPIIVHVASEEMAANCVSNWPSSARKLAKAFWPGPLTLVLPRGQQIPDIVAAGGSTVGIRWPNHPFIQAVIRMCGFPLAAPSANLSSRISPTSAEHVSKQLGTRIKLIVDGGQSQVGIESTVLDLSVSPPEILRPGMIHADALTAVIGTVSHAREKRTSTSRAEKGVRTKDDASTATLKSPGLLEKHYAPRARLLVLSWRNDSELHARLARETSLLTQCHIIAHSRIPSIEGFGGVSIIPHDPEAFARAIYGELHQCDEAGAELIVVEAPPNTIEWSAIMDRLQRASM